MFYRSKVMAMLGTTIFFTALPFTSMASNSTINSVSLDIVSDIEIGSGDNDVDVTTNSDMYHVDKVSINKPDNDWADGDQPIVEVDLKTDDNYIFSNGLSKKNISINGSEGTVFYVIRRSNSNIVVSIGLKTLKDDASNYDLNVGELEWDEMHGTVRWDAAGDAYNYQVRLYHGSSAVTSILTTQNPNYDFSSYITKEGYYTYKVRALTSSSRKGKWKKSESLHVTSDDAAKIISGRSADRLADICSGSWLNDNKGWRYRNADRSNTVNNWQYINDKWYYFNESGYMVTGWVNWKTKWYYCGDDGAMVTNTTTPDGCHVGSDGARTGS